ncbi:MAG TPA: hypothetical protein VD735_07795 [Candidatus Saccharimonadales bacterium]|nr:hypothetical protein [Candidatus Saccharimonadales bacterium]
MARGKKQLPETGTQFSGDFRREFRSHLSVASVGGLPAPDTVPIHKDMVTFKLLRVVERETAGMLQDTIWHRLGTLARPEDWRMSFWGGLRATLCDPYDVAKAHSIREGEPLTMQGRSAILRNVGHYALADQTTAVATDIHLSRQQWLDGEAMDIHLQLASTHSRNRDLVADQAAIKEELATHMQLPTGRIALGTPYVLLGRIEAERYPGFDAVHDALQPLIGTELPLQGLEAGKKGRPNLIPWATHPQKRPDFL